MQHPFSNILPNAPHSTLSLPTYNTCATNGVMTAPILAAAEQKPIAVALTLVGKTSGVYTYTAMKTPAATARIRNRNTVITSLQEETRLLSHTKRYGGHSHKHCHCYK